MKKLVMLIVVMFLASCISPYVPPADVDLVKVIYKSDYSPKVGWFSEALTVVYIYDDGDCGSVKSLGVLKGSKEEPDQFEVMVPSNKVLFNSYRTSNPNGFTFTSTKFTPEPGKVYEIKVIPYAGGIVSELTPDGEKPVPSAVPRREICKA